MEEKLLELINVSHFYTNGHSNTMVLQDINLTIKKGEMIAIIGPSGSGKSTLLNILGCLATSTTGDYLIAGQDTRSFTSDRLAKIRREYFGFVFQKYNLLPHLTAIQNVEMPAIYAGMERGARQKFAGSLLSGLGLAERFHYRPAQLSGGQQQRVSIARALINGAQVILADEPTGALDRTAHNEVLSQLRALHAEGHTIIIVTHDPETAATSDRIVEIEDGKIISDRNIKPLQSLRDNKNNPKNGVFASSSFSIEHFFTALYLAWGAMNTHRLRTLLTMLGIVIGIASVISITALGEGTKYRVVNDLNANNNYTIDIYPGKDWGDDSPDSQESLQEMDISRLERLSFVNGVSPLIYTSEVVRFGSNSINVALTGVNQSYFYSADLKLVAGTFLGREDITRQSQIIVIDHNLSKRLFGSEDPLGKVIIIGQVPCRIIGVVLPPKSLFGNDSRLNVWMPYTTLTARFNGQSYFNSLKVSMTSGNVLDKINSLEGLLLDLHGRKDFFIYNNDDAIKSIQKIATTLTIMVSSIALISLIVGGVGVMNIMLVSVSERTREIGILMAVGARKSDIREQFLIESVLVCMSSGLIGIGIAWLISVVFNVLQDSIVMELSPMSIILACLTSMITGIGFGFIPARNASQLDPVLALAGE